MPNTFRAKVLLFVFGAASLAILFVSSLAQEITYDVPLIAQKYEDSCWAASLQMLLTYFREQSFDQDAIAEDAGFKLTDYYTWDELQKAIKYWEFCVNPTACFLPEGWRKLLKERGPLWVVRRTGEKITHAIILKGMSENQESPTMYVNDPWPVDVGSDEPMTYEEFEKVYESVEEKEPGYVIQILYYCGERAKTTIKAAIAGFRTP